MRFAVALGVLTVCACGSFSDATQSQGPDASATSSDAAASSDAGSPDAETQDATAPLPGPLAHWKMDETGGTKVSDSAGNHDGLFVGEGAFVGGKLENAFSTEGGSAHVQVGNTQGLAVTTQFTIAMWINLFSSTNDSFFYSHGGQFSLKLNVRRPQIYVGPFFLNVAYSVPTEEWHHVAATFDSGIAKIYVDGIDAGQDETEESVTSAPALTDAILIGTSRGKTNPALGFIDDVKFWSRALAPDEIAKLVP